MSQIAFQVGETCAAEKRILLVLICCRRLSSLRWPDRALTVLIEERRIDGQLGQFVERGFSNAVFDAKGKQVGKGGAIYSTIVGKSRGRRPGTKPKHVIYRMKRDAI